MYDVRFSTDKKTLSDKELVEVLKEECRRIKIQRNDYEQLLLHANRKISFLKYENENLTAYIDRNRKKYQNQT
jgi:hypothetical protein